MAGSAAARAALAELRELPEVPLGFEDQQRVNETFKPVDDEEQSDPDEWMTIYKDENYKVDGK